ncbi:nucleotide disphospho-sugar-binding domain-containing protein [Actinomadura harenae]|uniref:DUF1205 domain-containing protein n=1 Tax=Actinomadura harenae TaxID=2483351 RepID=A0A3M2M2Z9_9ACTN|nr:nucleotide disphospho-sugar-binding domain-containing protein [Actinomadura harenae]RMI43173.1 DUF1205 domain-containing protein [Actinomadura harenae]
MATTHVTYVRGGHMRVLFTVSSWRGHYFCMVPLGWALQAAGHDVRFACPPDQTASIDGAGLVAVPVLDSVDWLVMARLSNYLEIVRGNREGLPLHPYTGRRVRRLDEFDPLPEALAFRERTQEAIRRSYDAAVDYARRWRPDLVIHDLTAPEGMLAAEVTGVPSVYHPPGLFGTAETEPGVDLGDGDKTGSFRRYGQEHYRTGRIRYAVDPSPDSAVPPMGSTLRLGMRYLPYNGPAVQPDWLREPRSRDRVCIVWGSSAAFEAEAEPTLNAAVEAALANGAEVVLTTSEAQRKELTGLPSEVRVLVGFPLNLLLEASDMVIHHGSVNTLMTAAAAGVPQLPTPFTDEQATVSGRIARTGAALPIRAVKADAERIAAGVETLLKGDAHREAALRLREVIAAQPSPLDMVAPLERLVREGVLTAADVPSAAARAGR